MTVVREKPRLCGEIPLEVPEDCNLRPMPKCSSEDVQAGFFFREVGDVARAIGSSLDFIAEQFRRVRVIPLSSDIRKVHVVVDMEVAMK